MLTFEKVLEIFADYLKEDPYAEVVRTRHCYALMMWDPAAHDWNDVIPCETPEELFDEILEQSDRYWSYLLAEEQDIDDFTPEIKAKVKEICRPFLEKRREAEGNSET